MEKLVGILISVELIITIFGGVGLLFIVSDYGIEYLLETSRKCWKCKNLFGKMQLIIIFIVFVPAILLGFILHFASEFVILVVRLGDKKQ